MPQKKKIPEECNRVGRPYPLLTCSQCGETKKAIYFPKRGGKYKKFKPLDARRYDTQCKKCKKVVPENPPPGYVKKEPITAYQAAAIRTNKIHEARRLKEKKEEIQKIKRRAAQKRRDVKRKQVRIESRVKSMLYLSEKGCEDCDERDPRKLEYDHRQPKDKSKTVSRLLLDSYTWESPVLQQEIEKCRILCANCHRLRTIKQQKYYQDDEVKLALGKLSVQYGFDL